MKPSRNILQVHPPLAGTHRSAGFQRQPPFTLYQSTNFWPIDHTNFRQTLATRPGKITLAAPSGGSPGKVNLLERINGVVSGKPLQSMIVAEAGQLYWYNNSGGWTAATGAKAGSIATGDNRVAAKTFLQQALIADGSNKPILFDYDAGTAVTLSESEGTCPSGLSMFQVWQGAVWAAGADDAPNVLYASRVGDLTDWDFTVAATDTGGAFFTGDEKEGLVRGTITAIIPHSDDMLLVSGSEGMIALYGHPRNGGIIEDFSDRIVRGPFAWCKGPDDTTYFLTDNGLYGLQSGSGTRPFPISKKIVPSFLGGEAADLVLPPLDGVVNSPNFRLSMAYDVTYHGIHIINSANSRECWWLDLNNNGLWHVEYSNLPLALLESTLTTGDTGVTDRYSTVLFGGADGLTQLGDPYEETVDCEALIGPLRLSPSMLSKSLVKMGRVLGEGTTSNNVTLKLACGRDSKNALDAANNDNHQFSEEYDHLVDSDSIFYPRVSGQAMVLHLESTSGHVVFDGAEFTLLPTGLNR